MPELTPNLGLKKPLGNETVVRATYNENLDILDQTVTKKGEGIAELISGSLVTRPEPGLPGRYFFAQDKGEIYLDTGTEWVLAAASQKDFKSHLAENVTDGDTPHGIIYEKGTWTPEINSLDTPATITYNNQLGRYIRHGNIVTSFFDIKINTVSGGGGFIFILGRPFAASTLPVGVALSHVSKITLRNNCTNFGVNSLSAGFRLHGYGSGIEFASSTILTVSELSDGCALSGSITYEIG